MSELGFPPRLEDLGPELLTALLRERSPQVVVRDLRVHRILEGTNEIMRMIVAREMLKNR